MIINWLPGKTVGRKNIKIYHFSLRILANWSSISAFSNWCVTSSSFDKGLHKKCMASPPPLRWQDRQDCMLSRHLQNTTLLQQKGILKLKLLVVFYDSVQKLSLCLESHRVGCCTKTARDTSLRKSCSKFTHRGSNRAGSRLDSVSSSPSTRTTFPPQVLKFFTSL